MSEATSIKCDNCDNERVIDSPRPHTFTLQLECVDTGINTSGRRYLVKQSPPLTGTKHFCNFNCLTRWLEGGVDE